MVVGVGIDIASIQRMERLLERHGDRISARILTEGERADLSRRSDRAQALAGRFAAKEAASKALGAPKEVGFHDLEVRQAPNGAPELRLIGRAQAHATRLGVTKTFVSITHDAGVAAAIVVLESERGSGAVPHGEGER